ncbi:hypothetical protein JYJ95_35040 [Corallococcus exiguus]|uniref:hypothetical protein n=1 Tax=Corallococcus exiguus TaxID=83462 RepID=UPI001A8F42CA|nr:hypothetical protein [Corallococcus exiguus]MBN8471753.1 hypothetical protein [Corallococcus exiguus]
MKKSLMSLSTVFALSFAAPTFASEPPPKSKRPDSICVLPSVPATVAKKSPNTKYPLGGINAPAVSCHDNKGKHAAGYHFKLYVGKGTDWPDAVARLDYLHKPEELTAACWNACIEQKKSCSSGFAKANADRQKLCEIQLQACKGVNDVKKNPADINSTSKKYCKTAAPPFPQVSPVQKEPSDNDDHEESPDDGGYF